MSTRCAARGSGFTLVELMVAAFLGSVVLYLLISVLIPALRISARGSLRVDLDQRASIMEQHIMRALQTTGRAGVKTGTMGLEKYLSMHPLEGALSRSKQKWASSLTVFVWAENSLSERVIELAERPPKALTLPEQQLAEALPESTRKLHIADVASFEARVDDGPRVDFDFTLQKEHEKLQIKRTVFLVNSSQ